MKMTKKNTRFNTHEFHEESNKISEKTFNKLQTLYKRRIYITQLINIEVINLITIVTY